jgi:hypothetical protein
MQHLALILALLLALLPWTPPANAGERIESTKKLGKNYFVVREPNSSDCRVEAKKVPKDAIMVGKGPYAGKQYAEAAIETLPNASRTQKPTSSSS